VFDGTTPPSDTANSYVPTACPGGRAPHEWLSDDRSLFDLLGVEFTLLRLGPHGSNSDAFLSTAAALRIPLLVVDIQTPEARDLCGAELVLVRPDQVVAWRGNERAQPEGVLRRVTGGE